MSFAGLMDDQASFNLMTVIETLKPLIYLNLSISKATCQPIGMTKALTH